MNFIDTHTHLFLKQFEDDIDDVIEIAIRSGITKMFLPNISSETTDSMLQLCEKYPENCFAMMGLHPCDVKKETMEKELFHVEEMLEKEKFIAVGEIGLDLYWDKTTLEIQKMAFEFQIELAKKHKLPIVIHVRDSFEQAIEIVENLNDENLSGVFHCFTGSVKLRRFCLDNEFYISLSGIVTFKNANQLREVINSFPLQQILIETDSPFLAPEPFRGKMNEPSYVKYISEYLSNFYNISHKEFNEITDNNFYNLFSKAIRYSEIS